MFDVNNPNYSSDIQGILYNKIQDTLIKCPVGIKDSVIITSWLYDVLLL